MIQATQTISWLKLGSTEQSYLAKGEDDYFHINNPKKEQNLLIFVSSHGEVCHSLSISSGTDPFKKIIAQNQQHELYLTKAN